MSVKVVFNKHRVITRIKKAWADTTPGLTRIVLDDCNKYCKEDTGALIKSSEKATNFEKGEIAWDTPYAHRQYWLVTAHKTVNPNATWRWADVAKSKHLKKWTRLAQEGFTKNL